MVDDLVHTAAGKCPYCQDPIDSPLNLSFDVLDPNKPPNYSANVRVCCLECNRSKRTMSPEQWAERLSTWEKYRKWIENIRSNPQMGLPLFRDA